MGICGVGKDGYATFSLCPQKVQWAIMVLEGLLWEVYEADGVTCDRLPNGTESESEDSGYGYAAYSRSEYGGDEEVLGGGGEGDNCGGCWELERAGGEICKLPAFFPVPSDCHTRRTPHDEHVPSMI